MMSLSRRVFLSLSALGILAKPSFAAPEPVGITKEISGEVRITQNGEILALNLEDPLFVGDALATAANGFAALELYSKTQVQLGPQAEFMIDNYAADIGGIITVGGAMVFDRPDDLPKIDLVVQNAFAQIGVRGTRFFAGPSKGVYGVFVARGSVTVAAGGETRVLNAGDGVDISAEGAPPSAAAQWKAPRIEAAFASVGLKP